MKKTLLAAASSVALLGITSQPVLAQELAPTRNQLESVPPKAEAPRSRVEVRSDKVQPGPCPLTESDLRTTIGEVRVTGPGGADLPAEIALLMRGITAPSGEQPIKVVCDLRDEAQGRLRAARYVASVQIPQQRIEGGVLRLEVVTGRITEVRVRGDAGPYERLLKSRIEQLRKLDPLNEADAERILLLAGDVPGLSVQLGLAPASGKPGDLIGELAVEYQPLAVIANVQNYGAAYLGRETALIHAEYRGLTGMGDLTALTLQTTADFKEQLVAQLRHTMTLNDAGTTLSIEGMVARSRPTIPNLDLRTLTLTGGFEVAHPLYRSVGTNLTLAGGFDYAMQRSRVHATNGGDAPLNRDRIAALYVRIGGETRKLRFDRSVIYSLETSVELRKGLDILGATLAPQSGAGGYGLSRFDGKADATILRGTIDAIISPVRWFELAANARMQWSNKPLLNFDQFALGNQTIGRGYDPGANTGDRAIGYTIEPRINFNLADKGRGQVFGFYDGVHLWNLSPNTIERQRQIDSVGGGVRATLDAGVRAELTYTHPLSKPLLTGEKPDDRVLFSLTFQLVPFGF